jgi:hypothetical protein
MRYPTSFLSKQGIRQNGRRAVAVVCLLLVCLLAGISAVHAHALPVAGKSIRPVAAPCELCAVAFKAALLFAIFFFLLHIVSITDQAFADPKPKSQFLGTYVWSRPPPLQF